jgi:hypothetical protein
MLNIEFVKHIDFGEITSLMNRPPDFVIGPKDDPYLRRWFLIPRNDVCNIYLHEILHDDDDRALHDHPWNFESIILKGSYLEHSKFSNGKPWHTIYSKGMVNTKAANQMHRLQVLEGPVLTLVFTGPRVREWGFDCPNGWRHWKEFCDDRDAGMVGKGCD